MELKSSGKIQEFETGSIRDNSSDKPRMELLPWDLMPRLARLYALGAKEYGDNNWRLGQPNSKVYGSIIRHLIKWILRRKDEDHLAAAIWNIFTIMHNETHYKDNPYICDMGTYSNLDNNIRDNEDLK